MDGSRLGLILGTRLYFNFHPAAVETDAAFMQQVGQAMAIEALRTVFFPGPTRALHRNENAVRLNGSIALAKGRCGGS